MKILGIVFLSFFLMQPTHAIAQDTRRFELQNADQKLYKVYKRILSRLPASDQPKFRLAQRAWVSFRESDCKWAFGAAPLDWMIHRTENRVRQLEETVFFGAIGEYEAAALKAK